jgi:hypothetical protein
VTSEALRAFLSSLLIRQDKTRNWARGILNWFKEPVKPSPVHLPKAEASPTRIAKTEAAK